MGCYNCAECGRFIDGDYDPCVEHPTVKFGLMCGDCTEKLGEEDEILANSD